MKIGFFDSGLGGLTILKAVAKVLPEYDYVYYGDTAHLPYGDKSEKDIYELTKAGVEYLFLHDCAIVIIACNTASAETLRKLQDEYLKATYPDRTILGVIIPVVEEVVASDISRALLLATKRTVSSGKYHFELGKLQHQTTKIEAEATPELVPLIESNKIEEAAEVAQKYIDPKVGEIDGVILGCTHYTTLKNNLREKYSTLQFFSQDEIIPLKLSEYLEKHTLLQERLTRNGTRNIHLTEHREDYDRLTAQFLEGRFIW